MSPLCLLNNENMCAKSSTVETLKSDTTVRVAYGYDWGTMSDNSALIFWHVEGIFRELRKEFGIEFEMFSLGGRDGSIYCNICSQLQSADIAVFDLSTHNVNVAFELGIAVGAGTHVFVLRSNHYKRQKRSFSDLNGILEYRFTRGSGKLKFEANFTRSLTEKLIKAAVDKIATFQGTDGQL
ncbi:MAG: hypothetical protein RDU24_09945 [Humidesulfovibrio sp.]|uniref:hypothetical protein n=1 Tax=Humidesulfovibrio sp. TaxID=2910988 RepID=UPI0027F16135|nr:hypothetical protein [Humidesulfovibrio sp.]MDQ7835691.1 hypothetical protein [Humidesulfovibrio sp.]